METYPLKAGYISYFNLCEGQRQNTILEAVTNFVFCQRATGRG